MKSPYWVVLICGVDGSKTSVVRSVVGRPELVG
jgi:hypothetical protein